MKALLPLSFLNENIVSFQPCNEQLDYRSLGVGDTGDNWGVICDGDFWERGDSVSLKHLDTNTYLATSGI